MRCRRGVLRVVVGCICRRKVNVLRMARFVSAARRLIRVVWLTLLLI